MELTEINQVVEDTEKKIKNIKDMIIDYNACVNETSKTVLLAAISKYASQFKPQAIAR